MSSRNWRGKGSSVNSGGEPPVPTAGSPVVTACGGLVRFERSLPDAIFHGVRVYFCLPSCKRLFEQNPKASCLCGNPLVEDSD